MTMNAFFRKSVWLGALLAGLASCADDTLGKGGEDVKTDGTSTSYLALEIVSDDATSRSTRAGEGTAWQGDSSLTDEDDFNENDDKEYALADGGAHRIFLFNRDGSYHSSTPIQKKEAGDGAHKKEKVVGTYIAQVTVGEDEVKPMYALVVINGDPDRVSALERELDGMGTSAMNTFEEKLVTLNAPSQGVSPVLHYTGAAFYTDGSTDYCTMSNSSYVDANQQTGTVQTAKTLAVDDFKVTEEQAASNPVSIHVERLAVKVEVKSYKGQDVGEENPNQYPMFVEPDADRSDLQLGDEQATTEKWKMVVWGWDVNGVEKQEYLFKYLNESTNENGQSSQHSSMTTGDNGVQFVNVTTKFFDYWNDQGRFRSYWAVDAHYWDPDIYPTQYRTAAKDEESVKSYEGQNDDQWPLAYNSYNQILNRTSGGSLLGRTKYRYCPENALGAPLVSGTNYQRAATHVIFIAQLLMGDETTTFDRESSSMEDVDDKYCDKRGFYYKSGDDYLKVAYDQLYKDLINKPLRNVKRHWGDKEGDITVPEQINKIEVMQGGSSVQELKPVGDGQNQTMLESVLFTYFELVDANVAHGDGKEIMMLKDGYTLRVTTASGTTDFDADEVKSIIYEYCGAVDHFYKGMMYYFVPIRHVQGDRDIATGGEYRLGDYGVIRNHWYRLNVTSLLRPGIPVDNPDQPIIPDVDPKDVYLGVDIHILPWHVISQDVTLR